MFKKSTVTLNLYTSRPEIYSQAQLKNAAANKPSWWKRLTNIKLTFDALDTEFKTMKGCAGFNDLYANSFILPMWSDFMFEYGEVGSNEWRYKFADGASEAQVHNQEQRGEWLPELNWQHLKLFTPWIGNCSEDINFLMTNAIYETQEPPEYQVLNGVVNFKYQSSTNVNMFFPRNSTSTTMLIPANRPMAMLIPLTERKVEIKHHLVSEEKVKQIQGTTMPVRHFQMGYYKNKKCPFSG